MRTHGEVHGNARLSPCGNYLTITVMAKRGKKMTPNVSTYKIEDVRPDPRVASSAYALTKGVLETIEIPVSRPNEDPGVETVHEFVASEEVWHVSVRDGFVECDCPHHTYHPNAPICKHAKALIAVGKINVVTNEEPR